ncbi:hypothetical protein HAX54_027525 [Datura stramonium]|uniref:Uncharacterized protein n=1 Tax=Datura stramonium TaxID=4076 RepID=A0ABS8V2I4_DATST|nr:hypothetical protein [Datura stramonium]
MKNCDHRTEFEGPAADCVGAQASGCLEEDGEGTIGLLALGGLAPGLVPKNGQGNCEMNRYKLANTVVEDEGGAARPPGTEFEGPAADCVGAQASGCLEEDGEGTIGLLALGGLAPGLVPVLLETVTIISGHLGNAFQKYKYNSDLQQCQESHSLVLSFMALPIAFCELHPLNVFFYS